ncbi:hypothetical protein LINPERHAP2_LOCUS15351 [Linum perenne]
MREMMIPRALPFEEKILIKRRWRNSLILRTLGKTLSRTFMSVTLQSLWEMKGRFQIWDIGFGHFIARFDEMQTTLELSSRDLGWWEITM